MRIEIPENIQHFGEGATCFHALCNMQIFLRIAARKLSAMYSQFPIDDMDAIEASILLRIINNMESFQTLCLIGKDYSACCTLSRSIADSLVVIKLIYQSKDKEEKEFRHYLYLLDGFISNEKLLAEELNKNGRITEKEYRALSEQYNSARNNFNQGIIFCRDKLKNHPYKVTYPDFYNAALKKGSWKYSQKRIRGNGAIPSYTWNELYKLIDERPAIVSMYSAYFSQFVHGLSISNISGHDDVDNFESLASCIVCLQGIVIEELKRIYNKDGCLLEYATDEDLHEIMALRSPEKRQEIIEKAYVFSRNKMK